MDLTIRGEFERLIPLHTDVAAAYSYFTDFGRVLARLPELERLVRYKDGRYRLVFDADDGRGHAMTCLFDIRHELIENESIRILPVPINPAEVEAMNRTNNPGFAPGKHDPNGKYVFSGLFAGETRFHHNARTNTAEITYNAGITLELEVPAFLAFLPQPVLHRVGDGLMTLKLKRVTEGFARNVQRDFQEGQRVPVGVAGRTAVSTNSPAAGESFGGLDPTLN